MAIYEIPTGPDQRTPNFDEDSMTIEQNTISADRDDPEAHARDVAAAIRERDTSSADTERAILAAGRGHARVLDKIAEPERHE